MDFLYFNLFSQYVKHLKVHENGQAGGICPFHTDTDPSFSVDLNTGQWMCHGCNKSGNAITLYRELGIDINRIVEPQIGTKILSEKQVQSVKRYNTYLLKNVEILKTENNIPAFWDNDILTKTKTGYDSQKQCITFTHFDYFGNPVNIKWHNKTDSITQIPDHGENRLYPLQLISNYSTTEPVIYCEGEKDCISLLSNGFQAITHTCGALSIPKDLHHLKNFVAIYIVFDHDPAGYNGAEELARKLKISNPDQSIFTYEWQMKTPPGFDVTDYFTNNGNKKGFNHMLDYATPFQNNFIADESYIKLYRKMIHSKVFVDPFLNQLWEWCLLEATHKRTYVNAKCGTGFKQIPLDKGQFLYNKSKAERELKQSSSTTRDRLKKLQSYGNIDISKVEGRTVVTICKWKLYQ